MGFTMRTLYLRTLSEEAIRDDLRAAIAMELHLRELIRTDPENAAMYRRSLDRWKERADAAQAEIDRRVA
jgi:hypothetical protein